MHGRQSGGIRVIDEQWRDYSYVLTLEGPIGDDVMVEVLDQSRYAASVEGARVMAHDGDHLILAVPFAGDQARGSYVRKELVIRT